MEIITYILELFSKYQHIFPLFLTYSVLLYGLLTYDDGDGIDKKFEWWESIFIYLFFIPLVIYFLLIVEPFDMIKARYRRYNVNKKKRGF